MTARPLHFTLRLASIPDRARSVAQVYRAALRRPMALVAKPQVRYALTVQAVSIDSRQYRAAELLHPERIIGIYQFLGNHDALLDAIMEDIEGEIEARVSLAASAPQDEAGRHDHPGNNSGHPLKAAITGQTGIGSDHAAYPEICPST